MGYTPVEVCLQFLVWALVSVLVLVLDKMVVLDWGFGLVLGFRLAWGFACLCVGRAPFAGCGKRRKSLFDAYLRHSGPVAD